MKFHRPTLLLAEIRESFAMAMGAVASHKLRSALTLLGVLIGVFSIVVVMTAMRVLKSNVEREMSRLGSHTFAIQKWPAQQFGGTWDWEKYRRRKEITIAQGRLLEEKATLAGSIGMEVNVWGGGQIETRYQKSPPMVTLFAETPGSFTARNWTVADGRAISQTDVESAHDVCVLGDALAKTLFPFGSPVGERLKINGANYTVIGVLEAQGGSNGGQQDTFAVIPITTGLNRFGRRRSLTLLVQSRDAASYEDTVEQVRGVLRAVRQVRPGDEDDFEVFSNDSLIEQFNNFTKAVRIGVSVVSSIALIAAGIGIMNIMLVSVTERTREIGVCRAVGAKRRNIMSQFIMEAVVLCEVGGVIGVALGIFAGNAVAWWLKIPAIIPVDWIALGLAICSVVGIVFGTYPAFKAANLDPIESLRYE